ncbi:hypothetical protein D3C73_806330 [compost metagenome]
MVSKFKTVAVSPKLTLTIFKFGFLPSKPTNGLVMVFCAKLVKLTGASRQVKARPLSRLFKVVGEEFMGC